MNQTAITYPETYTRYLSGKQLKQILEDVCDNLFNRDPYYRQGGDMVRVGGMTYCCNPFQQSGQRISDLRLNNGEKLMPDKRYSVSGWATVNNQSSGPPVWEQVRVYLADRQTVKIGDLPQPLSI